MRFRFPRPRRTPDGPPYARIDRRLLAQQIIASVLGRKGRAVLTASGIAIGIVVFIMTYGWTLAASSVINQQFDETVATTISVKARDGSDVSLDDDFAERALALEGVVAAGRYAPSEQLECAAHPGQSVIVPSVIADPGYFRAAGAELSVGRFYDAGAAALPNPAVVLGPAAARQLGLSRLEPGVSITCKGVKMPVYGILSDAGDSVALGATVVLSAPLGYRKMTDLAGESLTGAVRTELGATKRVAAVIARQVAPYHSDDVAVTVPPSPEELRQDVTSSVNTLAVGVSILSLVVGGIGIMTTMLTSVMERTREIGLRRALGARPRHIAGQFVVEGTLYGFGGAAVGLCVGLIGLVILVTAKGWTPVMEPVIALSVLPIGAVVGAVASLVPGIRAARIPPATALRAS